MALYPTLTINSQEFQVLEIQEENSIMRIISTNMFNVCSYGNLSNTTLDSTLFDYAYESNSMVNLLFDCSPVNGSDLDRFLFTCNNTQRANYFVEDWRLTSLTRFPLCATAVKVPLSQVEFNKVLDGQVRLQDTVNKGFYVQYTSQYQDDCFMCKNSGGICGSNTNGQQFSCLCTDRAHARVCSNIQEARRKMIRLRWILGIGAGVGLCIIFLIIVYYLKRKKVISLQIWENKMKRERDLNSLISQCIPLPLKRYRFTDVKKMTCSFRDKLGQGGYGGVYKGQLFKNGDFVAVKVLNISKGNGDDFINEVASISRTSHVNIVSLVGYCLDGRKRALIYEYMPNGSLEKFINHDDNKLSWEKLYKISLGIARGLQYLHYGCNVRILHFDIKPNNILLDEDFCPKISDFGLAKLCMKKESIVSMIEARGTIGYIAPEIFYRNVGEVSNKSDVYSYGMMIIEMVGKCKNINVGVSDSSDIYFPDCIYKHLRFGEHINLPGVETKEENEIVRKMLIVGLWCIQTIPSDRPSISKVIEMFEGNVDVLQVPQKPSISPPKRSLVVPSSSTT